MTLWENKILDRKIFHGKLRGSHLNKICVHQHIGTGFLPN